MAFTGEVVEIPIGTLGLTGTQNLSSVNPGYLTEATNVSFYDGTLRKEGGIAKYNSSAISGAPTILGGWDHRTNALAQRMIVAASDGKLYKDSGAGTFPTTLKSGLSASMRPFFVEGGKEAAAGNRKLFVFTGTNVVQVLADDGATTADISAPPADWAAANQPTWGVIHAGRLLAGGNANDPHRVYVSLATNHEDFTTTPVSFSIYAGEGDAIVGAISFQGFVVLWKRPLGVYVLDARNADLATWTTKRITRAVGGISPWAMVQTERDVIFVDSTGAIQSLLAVQEFGDIADRNLGEQSMLEPLLRSQFNLARLNQIQGVYYTSKRELHFAYPSAGATVNDSRLVLDFYMPDKVRFRNSQRETCVSLWLRRDTNGLPRVMVGDNAGFVWQLDQAQRAKDGVAYTAQAKTVPTDLGYANGDLAHRTKNACFLELVYAPTTSNMVSVDLEWDGRYRETIEFTLAPSGATFDNIILDTTMLGGSTYEFTKLHRITGGGKYLALTFRNSGLNQDFAIARARLYLTPANQ
jgi:hypothetical protein